VFGFQQDGMYVPETAQTRMGEAPVKSGMLHGDQLVFTLEVGRGERTFTQNFVATVTADSMAGTLTTERGENPFTGKRKASSEGRSLP
jgi:hypothetical protein